MAKKFLDQDGLTYLVSKLDDYPTNEILAAVIDGMDEVKQDTLETVDLSSYNANDVIPEEIIEKLLKINNTVKYQNQYYHIVSDTTTSGTRVLLYAALNTTTGGGGFTIYLSTGASDWIFSGKINIEILGYDANNILNIKLSNTNKAFNLKDGGTNTEIRKNSNQTGSIVLNLPSTDGTIALTSDVSNPTSEEIISALGYTPYNSTNPNGYITGITNSDVTTALGYTPYNSTNPNGYITGITSSNIISALGYTPYNSTNPNEYISGISSSDVTTALGYTPYNSTNPNNFITQTTNNLTNYYKKSEIDNMVGNRFSAIIVSTLPASNISTSTIYMILQNGKTDVYDEWMYISDVWTKIGTTSVDMSEYAKSDDLHNVAYTGSYASLTGKPTIPSDTSELTNGAGYITKSVNNLDNYTKTSSLASVAISGSYNDLSNVPTIPTQISQLANDSSYIRQSDLSNINISSLKNDVPYATLNDIQGLQNIDVDAINRAINATENIGTVTSVTAGTGLTGGGITSVTLNHSNSVTAKSNYPAGTSLSNGGSFTIRDVQYDAQGHITNSQDRTITMASIPAYNDTEVRELITEETSARVNTDTRVTAIENNMKNEFTQYVFCIFGIEPYIDPTTMQIVPNRYYQRSDVDSGIFMDNHKIDIHLKTWLKYHYNIDSLDYLKNITCYVYAIGDHGEYVNHMVTFWSQINNPNISSYPNLQQVGSFIDDGYGSVHRFSTTQVGTILSSTDDGYIQADPTGTGKGFVSGWNTLVERINTVESSLADIASLLDEINGEVI